MIRLRPFAFWLLALSLCVLSGCGFHLRNHYHRLDDQYPVMVLPATGTDSFHRALRNALQMTSIRVLDASDSDDKNLPTLTIVSEDLHAQPLVYGSDSELRRERLQLQVVFTFIDGISPEAKQIEFFTKRERQLNSNQHLGDNAEKILIEQEMQTDIIAQLLLFLSHRSSD